MKGDLVLKVGDTLIDGALIIGAAQCEKKQNFKSCATVNLGSVTQ